MPKALPAIDTTAPVCCAPLARGALSEDDALQVAVRLKALADPVRVRLVSLMLAAGDDGACTCDLAPAVDLSEATVSHHLKLLRGRWAGQRDPPRDERVLPALARGPRRALSRHRPRLLLRALGAPVNGCTPTFVQPTVLQAAGPARESGPARECCDARRCAT